MAVEAATHITDLVSTNPTGSDTKSEGDNHIRLVKAVLLTDFAAISGAVTATHTELNQLAGNTAYVVGGTDVAVADGGTGASTAAAALTALGAVGKQTIFIPAGAMRPTKSNGCSALTEVEISSGQPDILVMDFDDGADEHAQFLITMPNSWNLGTLTFQVYWTTSATDTDGVAWGLQAVGLADNESIGTAWSGGTPVVVTDDAQSAANELLVTAESGALTVGGTPADGDLTYFRIFRDVSDANDDMTEDARLLGVKLHYTTDAGTDA